VIAVDPRDTSRQCLERGHTAKEDRPTRQKFHCVVRGHTAHADTVGATNVLRAGPGRSVVTPTRRNEKPPASAGGAVNDSVSHACRVTGITAPSTPHTSARDNCSSTATLDGPGNEALVEAVLLCGIEAFEGFDVRKQQTHRI
jgi:hypothetical protein